METNKTTVPKGGYVGKYCIINLTTADGSRRTGDDFYRSIWEDTDLELP
jgi:hypothetical protein